MDDTMADFVLALFCICAEIVCSDGFFSVYKDLHII